MRYYMLGEGNSKNIGAKDLEAADKAGSSAGINMTNTKRILTILLAAATGLAALGCNAGAGELDVRMAKIVKTFSRAAAEAGVSTDTLAVLPFQTDKKLAEKRVDYACAEILSNRFVEANTFTVTERARLGEVMKEQALGLSGAIESATAAKLGRLLGARLVILGSVSRLADSYHLSTEMVDSETGEIIASDVTEVAVEVFDKDAARYEVLVPEEQAIGIYGVGISAPMEIKTAPAITRSGNTVKPLNPAGGLMAIGVGVRYYPWSRWMMDLMLMVHTEINPDAVGYSLNGHLPNGGTEWRGDGPTAQFTINRTFRFSKKFNGFAGAGMTTINLNNKLGTEGGNSNAGITNNSVTVKMDEMKAAYTTPTARLGLEWKPKERFSIAVFGNYNFSRQVIKEMATVTSTSGFTGRMAIREFSFPAFYAAATLALYF